VHAYLPGKRGTCREVRDDKGHVAFLGHHRVLGVDAALAYARPRMGVHVTGDDPLLGVADVPELAVGQAVELDAAGQAVRVEVVEVDDPGDGAPISGPVGEQERAGFPGTAAAEPLSGAATEYSPTTWSRSAPWPADPVRRAVTALLPRSPKFSSPTFSGRSS
jgi:hypothetical protein